MAALATCASHCMAHVPPFIDLGHQQRPGRLHQQAASSCGRCCVRACLQPCMPTRPRHLLVAPVAAGERHLVVPQEQLDAPAQPPAQNDAADWVPVFQLFRHGLALRRTGEPDVQRHSDRLCQPAGAENGEVAAVRCSPLCLHGGMVMRMQPSRALPLAGRRPAARWASLMAAQAQPVALSAA